MFKINNRLLFFGSLFFISLLAFCGDEAIFDNLANNQLEVRFKTTYASNNPQPWAFPGIESVVDYNSVDDYLGSEGEAPTMCLFDLAEMRINNDKFANYRQEIRFNLDSTGSSSSICGEGIVLDNDDVKPDKEYSYLSLYFRKMIVDKTKKYQAGATGWNLYEDEDSSAKDGANWDVFFEKEVEGYNFNLLQVNTYYDSLHNNRSDINRVFPLLVPIKGGLVFDRDKAAKLVLEIRIVINNYLKRFEDDSDLSDGLLVHYYALSDWVRDVKIGQEYIGGNILAVARAYYEGETGTITGTNSGTDAYLIAIPEEDNISQYTLSSNSRPIRGDLPIYPKAPSEQVEQVLDYYLKLEKYKIDWNNNIPTGATQEEQFADYQEQWDNYESVVGGLELPPLAVFVSGGDDFEIKNVSPGNYKVYRADKPNYGEWFKDGDFTVSNEDVITVSANSSIQVTF